MAKRIRDYENFDKINKHTTNYIAHINSLSHDEYFEYIKKIDKEPIKYDESLSLMEIGKKLNDLYVAFMKDYKALPVKLDLGEELDICYYREGDYQTFCRSARIFVYLNNQMKGNNCSAEFLIMEHGGEIKNVFTNNHLRCSSNSKKFYKDLKIDDSILKSYLDLFQKHQDFIKVFANTERVGLSDQTWVMMGLYKDRDLDITNGLKKLQIHGYLSDTYDFLFEINFKLGEDFGIDFETTKFMIHDRKVNFSKEDITDFANSIFVNKYYVLVGINKAPLYEQYDFYDPSIQYKFCEFGEKLKEKFKREFSNYEIIKILKAMIKLYSKQIKLYYEQNKDEKETLQNNVRALFELDSYENIIANYEKEINKKIPSRRRKKDDQ